VEYGKMAAKRAASVYAYGEAVRLLDQAIKVQKVLNPDNKEKMCDLLLELCTALFYAADTRRIIEVEAPAELSLAESLNDGSRAVQACTVATLAIIFDRPAYYQVDKQFIEWIRRADRFARDGTKERARG
jgi:hypothetical protein